MISPDVNDHLERAFGFPPARAPLHAFDNPRPGIDADEHITRLRGTLEKIERRAGASYLCAYRHPPSRTAPP
jgi:hypothetical protein